MLLAFKAGSVKLERASGSCTAAQCVLTLQVTEVPGCISGTGECHPVLVWFYKKTFARWRCV